MRDSNVSISLVRGYDEAFEIEKIAVEPRKNYFEYFVDFFPSTIEEGVGRWRASWADVLELPEGHCILHLLSGLCIACRHDIGCERNVSSHEIFHLLWCEEACMWNIVSSCMWS